MQRRHYLVAIAAATLRLALRSTAPRAPRDRSLWSGSRTREGVRQPFRLPAAIDVRFTPKSGHLLIV